AARTSEPTGQDQAGHRHVACPGTGWRLVDMAARLRCYRLFAPKSDQSGQCAPSAIGVGMVAAERTERGDTAGPGRRVVCARLRRQGPGLHLRSAATKKIRAVRGKPSARVFDPEIAGLLRRAGAVPLQNFGTINLPLSDLCLE